LLINKQEFFIQTMKTKNLFLTAVLAIFFLGVKAQQEIPNISDPRLDFTVVDLKGDSIKLSSLKGKVLLIDFWASWCGPCRYSNKNLVKLYSKYKAKGFEIFGISLDEEKGDWKKAIAKDKITWLQGNDNRGWEATTAMKWNIQAIPSSFLINKKGDVVAIDLEKDKLEAKLKELLGL